MEQFDCQVDQTTYQELLKSVLTTSGVVFVEVGRQLMQKLCVDIWDTQH